MVIYNKKSFNVKMGMSKLRELSIMDTNVLKGVALLILLFHHLWYQDANADLNRNGILDGMEPYLQLVSISGKICVAIFVFFIRVWTN